MKQLTKTLKYLYNVCQLSYTTVSIMSSILLISDLFNITDKSLTNFLFVSDYLFAMHFLYMIDYNTIYNL
jgi:hypothetical protein